MGIYGYFSHDLVINFYKNGESSTREDLESIQNYFEKRMKETYPAYAKRFWKFFQDGEIPSIKLKERDYWETPTVIVAQLLMILEQAYKSGFFIYDARTTYEDDVGAGCVKCVDIDKKNVQISFLDTCREVVVANGRIAFITIFDFEDLKVPNLIEHCAKKPPTPLFRK